MNMPAPGRLLIESAFAIKPELLCDKLLNLKHKMSEIDRQNAYWSAAPDIRSTLAKIKDGMGTPIYTMDIKPEFKRVCQDCKQNVYEVITLEWIFGLPVRWDNASGRIELMRRDVSVYQISASLLLVNELSRLNI